MEKIVVLLRGINVGASRKLPMAELRAAAREAGFEDIETYIQSGNLVLTAQSAAAAEEAIEALIAKHFKMKVEAIARTAKQWAAYARGSPFADADERANRVHLGLSKKKPAAGAVDKLAEKAAHGETIVIDGDAIWVDFREGVGISKLRSEERRVGKEC